MLDMNKKRRNIIIIIFSVASILILWITGIIPKKIAQIYGTCYLNKNFPKIQLDVLLYLQTQLHKANRLL